MTPLERRRFEEETELLQVFRDLVRRDLPETAYKLLMEAGINSLDRWLSIINRYEHSNRIYQAIEFAATLSKFRPKNKALYIALCRLYHKSGETTGLLDTLPRALAHLDHMQFRSLVEALSRALSNYDVYHLLEMVRKELSDEDLEHFDPPFILSAILAGQSTRARQIFSERGLEEVEHPDLRLTEIKLSLIARQFDAAFELAIKARATYPEDSDIRTAYIEACSRIGDYERFFAAITDLMRIPQYRTRGLIHLQQYHSPTPLLKRYIDTLGLPDLTGPTVMLGSTVGL